MKNIPLIIFLVLASCNIRDGQKVLKFGEAKDPSGQQRLLLLYTPMKFGDHEGGYDFHSLVWQKKENLFWTDFLIITKDEFQAGIDRTRWVSELLSFDPKTGYAVIKVGEADNPKPTEKVSHTINYNYSWREWNLKTNQEVRFFKSCESPLDPF